MIDTRLGVTRRYPELERLVCAAVSNTGFAAQLLVAPEAALSLLEYGLKLSPTERELVVNSTNGAADIHDFAARLYAEIQQPWHACSEETEGTGERKELTSEPEVPGQFPRPLVPRVPLCRDLKELRGSSVLVQEQINH